MLKNKTIKLFLILGVIFFSLIGISGCSKENGNEKEDEEIVVSEKETEEVVIYEKENKEIVSFPKPFYTVTLSSVNGQPIVLTMENASFLVSLEKGSFEYLNDVKECSVDSGKTFFYCPTYGPAESFTIVKEDAFIDVKVLIDEKIVGYCVIKINNIDNDLMWEPELLISNLFVDKDGKIVSVDEKYVNDRIKYYHK